MEFQQRWGHDLLDALWYLEREGRIHRDLKPDNLGVTEVGSNREQHLVLFDFSLAGALSDDITAGTPPYLDPFLDDRTPPWWDLAAERYAAAVTLYEMTTGETPLWGDGQPDPRSPTARCPWNRPCSTRRSGTRSSGSSPPRCGATRRNVSGTPSRCFGRGNGCSTIWMSPQRRAAHDAAGHRR